MYFHAIIACVTCLRKKDKSPDNAVPKWIIKNQTISQSPCDYILHKHKQDIFELFDKIFNNADVQEQKKFIILYCEKQYSFEELKDLKCVIEKCSKHQFVAVIFFYCHKILIICNYNNEK